MQPDGKIVLAGYAKISSDYDFAVVRYNADSTLDSNFGTNGIVTTNIRDSIDTCWSVAIQPDGKIIVLGRSWVGSYDDFAVVRYNTNGSLDTSFGTGGLVSTDIGGSRDEGKAIVIQSDGKIIVAGYAYIGNYNDFAVVRYNSDGSLDTGFGTGGIIITDIGGNRDEAHSIAIQSDGKIVVSGSYGPGGPVPKVGNDIAIVRYK